MSPRTPDTADDAPAGTSRFGTTLLFVLVGVSAVQAAFTVGLTRRLGDVEAKLDSLAKPSPSPAAPRAPNAFAGEGTLDEKVDAVRGDLDLLVNDVQRIERKLDDLTTQLENRGTVRVGPAQPPDLDWTEPALFGVAQKGAESCGFALTKDALRCPARLILREGLIEYFAVLKGGKEHETVFSIVGNTPPDARRPKDMGVKLSNAIQALGFHRGHPVSVGPSGAEPASGETIWIYAEWTTGGKTEIVRAEDLVWHRVENRPMKPGSWVYVGSQFVEGEEAGTLEYVADLTAEAVASYSSPGTIVDNTDTGAEDDTVFLVATPRIPTDVDHCTLIFRKEPLPADQVKTFPPVPSGGGGGDDEGEKGGGGK